MSLPCVPSRQNKRRACSASRGGQKTGTERLRRDQDGGGKKDARERQHRRGGRGWISLVRRQSSRFFSLSSSSIGDTCRLIPRFAIAAAPSLESFQAIASPAESDRNSHHSKAKTHSVLAGLPGHGADAAAGESADAGEDDIDQPHRCSAVAAARATAVAPSGLKTPQNREGGPPATR